MYHSLKLVLKHCALGQHWFGRSEDVSLFEISFHIHSFGPLAWRMCFSLKKLWICSHALCCPIWMCHSLKISIYALFCGPMVNAPFSKDSFHTYCFGIFLEDVSLSLTSFHTFFYSISGCVINSLSKSSFHANFSLFVDVTNLIAFMHSFGLLLNVSFWILVVVCVVIWNWFSDIVLVGTFGGCNVLDIWIHYGIWCEIRVKSYRAQCTMTWTSPTHFLWLCTLHWIIGSSAWHRIQSSLTVYFHYLLLLCLFFTMS